MIEDKVLVYYPIFEDLKALSVTLPLNRQYGFKHFLTIDGPYVGYPHQVSHSSDGLQEFVEREKIPYIQAGEVFNQDKLNMAFDYATKNGFKYLVLMGCDCYFTGNIDEFYQSLKNNYEGKDEPDIALVKLKECQPQNKYNRDIPAVPRVFVNTHRIRAKNIHWYYYFDNNTRPILSHKVTVNGCIMIHDDSVRNPERNQIMEEYQNFNVVRERGIIKELTPQPKKAH